ncbi:MAG: esterase [Nocardia sp.]|nr:esterase [Nocardia sp.]
MHHIARRSAAATMAVAGAALLFTAGCSDDNKDNNSSGTTSMSPGMTMSGSPAAGAPGGGQASGETKIPGANGQEFTIAGNILDKYNKEGGPQGTLGAPTGNKVDGPNGGSCQEFTGGAICWSQQTDAHIVWGDIRGAWEQNGGVNGKLGYPTSDEKDSQGGKEADFTGGNITWNSSNRQTQVNPK